MPPSWPDAPKSEHSVYKCLDCETFPDGFMLHDALWLKAIHGYDPRSFLCFSCCELRLGHEIKAEHLKPDALLNRILFLVMERHNATIS